MDDKTVQVLKKDIMSPSNTPDLSVIDNNIWEDCANSLSQQAVVILDKNLKVLHANQTIERWGWGNVSQAKGMHILSLIRPAIEHDSENNWIGEWCQLDTQTRVEWTATNYKTNKTYRFTFCPHTNETTSNNDRFYAAMIISDITDQKILNKKKEKIAVTEVDEPAEEGADTDLIRLSAYRLHQLANRLISSQEDERKRVSSELHDGLGQILSALKYQVESAVMEAEQSANARKSDLTLKEILGNVTVALGELRRVSVNLRPSLLEDLGLLMTLAWFTKEYNKVYTKLNVDLKLEVSEEDIPDKNKDTVYRIIQESMNNIAKHSNANNVFIRLTKTEVGVLLRITDDGSGFDLKKVKASKKSGLGLKSMEERAVSTGGVFTMASDILTGTVVQVIWEFV